MPTIVDSDEDYSDGSDDDFVILHESEPKG